MWDPTTYLHFGDERARPFADLVARIAAPAARRVVDLGCGPGTLTAGLTGRWPDAQVSGLDSSPEMIDKAKALGSTVDFSIGDVRDWHPDSTVDVVVSNATLQWVPGHADLLVRWARELAHGWLAFQVPGNFDAPSHLALHRVLDRPQWRDRVALFQREPPAVLDPAGYADLLLGEGWAVDAWETTYLHLLPADPTEHPVLRWMEGTALRPVRAALPPAQWPAFCADLRPELAAAYPVRGEVVPFPFRRVFVVAHLST